MANKYKIKAIEYDSRGELRDIISESLLELRQDILKSQDSARKVMFALGYLSKKESENFQASVLDVINDPDYSLLIYINELIDKLAVTELSYEPIETK